MADLKCPYCARKFAEVNDNYIKSVKVIADELPINAIKLKTNCRRCKKTFFIFINNK